MFKFFLSSIYVFDVITFDTRVCSGFLHWNANLPCPRSVVSVPRFTGFIVRKKKSLSFVFFTNFNDILLLHDRRMPTPHFPPLGVLTGFLVIEMMLSGGSKTAR